jgi:hypothetical protein
MGHRMVCSTIAAHMSTIMDGYVIAPLDAGVTDGATRGVPRLRVHEMLLPNL